MSLSDSGDLLRECLEHQLDDLYTEFENLGGSAEMARVTKYDSYRYISYQKIMNIREKWAILSHKLIEMGIDDNDVKNKIFNQSIMLNCEDISASLD